MIEGITTTTIGRQLVSSYGDKRQGETERWC